MARRDVGWLGRYQGAGMKLLFHINNIWKQMYWMVGRPLFSPRYFAAFFLIEPVKSKKNHEIKSDFNNNTNRI